MRSKGRCDRTLRHEDWGLRHVVIELEARKFQCGECGRGFRQRFPGIQPWQRASEAFQRQLSSTYRSLVRKCFPNARIVAGRFHVIRLMNHHFLACWHDLDPAGSKHRGLLSLMRRHRHNLKPEQLARLMNYLAAQPVLELITRNNRMTEGFHTKMELINRQAYGFPNFKNYRMRVKVLCA